MTPYTTTFLATLEQPSHLCPCDTPIIRTRTATNLQLSATRNPDYHHPAANIYQHELTTHLCAVLHPTDAVPATQCNDAANPDTLPLTTNNTIDSNSLLLTDMAIPDTIPPVHTSHTPHSQTPNAPVYCPKHTLTNSSNASHIHFNLNSAPTRPAFTEWCQKHNLMTKMIQHLINRRRMEDILVLVHSITTTATLHPDNFTDATTQHDDAEFKRHQFHENTTHITLNTTNTSTKQTLQSDEVHAPYILLWPPTQLQTMSTL